MPEPPHGVREDVAHFLQIDAFAAMRWKRAVRSAIRRTAWRPLVCLAALCVANHAVASDEIRHYRSPHFQLWTDLPDDQAERSLRRMEQVLGIAQQYWQRCLRGQIHCYLVHDLQRWPLERFPDRRAPQVLRQVRGGTNAVATGTRTNRSVQAVIYAMAEPRVVEHEVVHAYCFQTFGRGGPDWYREGMAELLSQEVQRASTGRIATETIERLRDVPAPTVHRVTRSGELKASLAAILAASPGTDDPEKTESDATATSPSALRLARARAAYAESWALCHLLYHSPNYRGRFQSLGRHLLSGAPIELDAAFSGRVHEIDFELAFFVDRLSATYQVELCEWDWNGPRRQLDVDQSITIRVKAARGYQPTSIRVVAGERYLIIAEGSWKIAADGDPLDADGAAYGAGCLEAIVLDGYDMSEPLALGKETDWMAPANGHLYLRCRDGWDQLADNRGTLAVRLTRSP